VLDAHRDGGGAHGLVEIMIRPGSGRTAITDAITPAVDVGAVIGEVVPKQYPNGADPRKSIDMSVNNS
jgi:hypothetical protein